MPSRRLAVPASNSRRRRFILVTLSFFMRCSTPGRCCGLTARWSLEHTTVLLPDGARNRFDELLTSRTRVKQRRAGVSQSAQTVADHYKKRALGDAILAALKAAGKDIERLTPDDLAPVDEFHSGGRNATVRLAQLAGITGSERVLDVGCGIGGPSRYLARKFGCRVTGLDLTQEFIALAAMLAQRTRLADKVAYRQGNALAMPFADASFDLVWSQNAAMNIADRDRLYGEMYRVLVPAGRLAFQDVAAGPGGGPPFPPPVGKRQKHQFSVYAAVDAGRAGAHRLPRPRLARFNAGGAGATACAR